MAGHVSAFLRKNWISAVCVAFAAAWSLSSLFFVLWSPASFKNLNSRIYDWKLSLRPVPGYSSEIVHVDVEDSAVQEWGQLPWDRAVSAKILDRLSEFGARVAVFDILYASPGKSKEGDEAFCHAIQRAGNVVSATGLGVLTDSADNTLDIPQDRERADALYEKCWPLSVPSQLNLLRVSKLRNSSLPLLPVIVASNSVGCIRATPDSDGVYRRVPLLIRLHDRCIPSLSLATLMAYKGLTPEDIVLDDKKHVKIRHASHVMEIPIDDRGMLLINWGKMWTGFKRYSVKDVLGDTPDPSRPARYKDKIVILAVTATGNTDFGTTPLSVNAPLSRIHSHALNTMLMGYFIVSVPFFPWLALFSVVLAMVLPLAAARLSFRAEAITLGLIGLGSFAAVTVAFSFWSYDVPISEFLFVFLPAAFGSLLIKGAFVEWQANRAKRALERYLPPEILESTLSRGVNLDLSTRRQEMTIVFVDVEGFSTLSEIVDIEYVSRFLKDFYGAMNRAVLQHQGRIHQFLGDGFLAVFGDLTPLDNHADAAFLAALDMQREMAGLSSTWAAFGLKEFQKGLRIRIGINTGVVFAGDLGSDRRLEYTVVGSAVNMASRLQSLATPGGIIMTARTKALLTNADLCQGPEVVTLRGFEREIEVFRVEPESIQEMRGSSLPAPETSITRNP